MHPLDGLFRPHRIAVVGASEVPGKVGYTLLRNLVSTGFEGVIYPVNAKREAVQGIVAYPSVEALPQPADLAVVCTPAETVPNVIRQCGASGVRGVIVISAGFREAGAAGRELEQQLLREARRFPRLRMIGPNCLGVIVPGWKMNASFAAATPAPGRVALISQSGALCTSFLDWAIERDMGFSYFVSIGNMLDVGFAELLDYFSADPRTDAVVMYVESVSESRQFMSAARAFARAKPIVAYKAGRFAASAQAAASHTGALAGVDAVYAAAFARAGIERVFDVDDMIDCAQLLARRKRPRGPRLAIITNAGGPGVMATDALLDRDGYLAELAPATIEQLSSQLPGSWSHGNPVDVLGDASPERYAAALRILLADAGVDAVLAILTPQAMTDPTGTARLLADVAGQTTKPVLAAWMGAGLVHAGVDLLERAGVPTYSTPEHAVRAFTHLLSYARNLETLHETPREVPLAMPAPAADAADPILAAHAAGRDQLTEVEAMSLVERYGIPTTRPRVARSVDEAVAAARAIGHPVVLKVMSPQITHKTDVGGVELGLGNDEAVRAAFERIVAGAARHRPDATVEGVTVERMVTTAGGFELILGAKRDPVFGPVLLVGSGGVAAEVYQDTALELPPLNERLALRMLRGLRSWPLLAGYRGRAGVDVDKLVETLLRLSRLIADRPEIRELDLNPLLATAHGIIALDARVMIDHALVENPPRRYAHLALRPYPDEYVRQATLRDGLNVLLRPIKPEDEPAWLEMLTHCSAETIAARFGHVIRLTTHEMAARYCFIDYDRELAIVAEAELDGQRKLLGIARLVADADRTEAEYAALVADPWQGRGLGSVLTDFCLDVARRWGLQRVYAVTNSFNTRMTSVFRHRGFEFATDPRDGTVSVTLDLAPSPAASSPPPDPQWQQAGA